MVYVPEVSHASRTRPYCRGRVSLAKVAESDDGDWRSWLDRRRQVAGVRESPVFPFVRSQASTRPRTEMKSTGEVMGSTNFGVAFAKAQLSIG
jgi:hypothetical protein